MHLLYVPDNELSSDKRNTCSPKREYNPISMDCFFGGRALSLIEIIFENAFVWTLYFVSVPALDFFIVLIRSPMKSHATDAEGCNTRLREIIPLVVKESNTPVQLSSFPFIFCEEIPYFDKSIFTMEDTDTSVTFENISTAFCYFGTIHTPCIIDGVVTCSSCQSAETVDRPGKTKGRPTSPAVK